MQTSIQTVLNLKAKSVGTVDKQTLNNYRQYHLPGCSNLMAVKKNVVFISNSNSIKHELAKSLGAIMIHRFGDLKFNKEILESLNNIEAEVIKMGWIKSEKDFITEACPCSNSKRRIDLVDLKTNTHYEFETSKKILKEGSVTIYI